MSNWTQSDKTRDSLLGVEEVQFRSGLKSSVGPSEPKGVPGVRIHETIK